MTNKNNSPIFGSSDVHHCRGLSTYVGWINEEERKSFYDTPTLKGQSHKILNPKFLCSTWQVAVL